MPTTTKPTASPYLRRLLEERAAHVAVVEALQGTAHSEGRSLTDDERVTLRSRADAIKMLDADLQISAEFAQGAARFTSLIGAQAEAEEERDRAHQNAQVRTTEADSRTTLGETFAAVVAEYAERPKGTSRFAALPSAGSPEFRAAIT